MNQSSKLISTTQEDNLENCIEHVLISFQPILEQRTTRWDVFKKKKKKSVIQNLTCIGRVVHTELNL